MLGEKIRSTKQKELIAEFEQTEKAIKEANLLLDNTLDGVLEEPIEGYSKTAPNDFNRLRGLPPRQFRDNYAQSNMPRNRQVRAAAGGLRQGLADREE